MFDEEHESDVHARWGSACEPTERIIEYSQRRTIQLFTGGNLKWSRGNSWFGILQSLGLLE